MIEAFKVFLRNYTNFNGRSTVRDYWMTILASIILGFVLGFVLGLLQLDVKIISTITGIISLAMVIPSLALSIRRLHDTNRSGWWFLLSLTGIGSIVLLIFYCLPSVDEGNKYGPIAK